jgi:predicted DCC family thiol-disulfide oxidoreductase YuxK
MERKISDEKFAYLLYDSECKICSRFMSVVRRLDLNRKITPVPLRDQLSINLVRGKLSKEEMLHSFHMVRVMNSGENQVFSAGDGLVELLEYMPFCSGFKSLANRVKTLRALVRWSYIQATRLRGPLCVKQTYP